MCTSADCSEVTQLGRRAGGLKAGKASSGNTGAEPLDAIEDNFRSMVTFAKDAHIRVVLSSVLPASGIPWAPGADPRQEIGSLNK